MGIEDKKSEGGNDVNEEQVKNIVTQVLAGQQEKTQLSQEMGELRKGIKDANEGLVGLKQLFCSEDGTVCFPTQAELNSYVERQNKTMETVEAKLTEVVEKVNNMKPAKGEGPKGLTPLEPMTEQKRKASTEGENLARDEQFDKIINFFKATDNDLYRRISRDKANITNIAKKPDIRGEVFDNATDEERKKMVLYGCKDGKCRVWRENMGKEEGLKFYLRDEKGTFQPVDQSKEKKADFFAT